jgi:hypothetical protein
LKNKLANMMGDKVEKQIGKHNGRCPPPEGPLPEGVERKSFKEIEELVIVILVIP